MTASGSIWLRSFEATQKMWQVEAVRPPNGDSRAASGSTWNGCGSQTRANSTTSSSVSSNSPLVRADPTSTSSK